MLLRQITEATQIWSRQGGKLVRKYRCTSGNRKGRVMASPASCNRPINVGKSVNLTKTRNKKTQQITMRSLLTKRVNPKSTRLNTLNKPKNKGRKI